VSEGFTPAQQRVIELAVAGLTNQEIAGRLFMSRRTVESHLTKAYRELGVRSRAQLIAALSNRDSPEGNDRAFDVAGRSNGDDAAEW
jgi:DNA-binding CsgD family transcriptional regulator